MLKIYLVRHGETSYNADGNRYCGKTDVDLTEKGLQQAEILGALLKDVEFEEVYSSPLKRALKTAKMVVPNRKIHVEKRLIELDFGNWEGKTRAEFISENKELWSSWCENPNETRAGGNGETAGELILRLEDFFKYILKKHTHGNILVVAHNAVNRFLIAHQLGMPLANYRKIVQENSSLTILGYDETEGFSLCKLNGR